MNERKVLKLVTPNRILLAEDVIKAWDKIIKECRTNHHLRLKVADPSINYSEQVLTEVLKKPMWRLIYDPGFSIADVYQILGSSPVRKPCHYSSNKWWLSSDWAEKKNKPRYYLIKVAGLYPGMDWQMQEERLNGTIARMSSRLMIIASISHFLLRGSYFRENHWGPEDGSEGTKRVSRVDSNGFSLSNRGLKQSGENLATYVFRKFDL